MSRGRLTAALGILGLVAGVGLGLGVGLGPERALAHAVLLRSVPPSSQTLARAPDEVRLLFSEPIDIVFSGIHVSNAAGQLVDRGDTRVEPGDDHQLVVSLQPALPDGIYTVAWRSLSTIDVHPDEGQSRLFVGVPVANEPAVAVSGNQITATAEVPPNTIFLDIWLPAEKAYGGAILLRNVTDSTVATRTSTRCR